MLRFLILLVVVVALLVFLRLLLLSFRGASSRPSQPVVIDMPVRVVPDWKVKACRFRDFDFRTGPPDPLRFCDRLYITLGSAGDSAREKKYSLIVATPAGLQDSMKAETRAFRFGRNLLLVERYDWEVIERTISRHLEELDALAEEVG